MRRPGPLLFGIAGVGFVIAGGLVSAIVAPAASEVAAWAVAYIVLVAGVAQVALGIGQAALAPSVPVVLIWAEFALFTAGNAGVVAGTVAGSLVLTDAGGALLFLSLVLFLIATRRPVPTRPLWLLVMFRAVLVIVAISIPVGLVIGHLKAA